MDITVLFSPTHGFWSDWGWHDYLSQASRVSRGSTVQVSFRKVSNVRRVQLSACRQLTHMELLRWALSLIKEQSHPALRKALEQRYGMDLSATPQDERTLRQLCQRVHLAHLGRLLSTHSAHDVYVGQRLDDVVVISREHAEPLEKAPLIPPHLVESARKRAALPLPGVRKPHPRAPASRTQGAKKR